MLAPRDEDPATRAGEVTRGERDGVDGLLGEIAPDLERPVQSGVELADDERDHRLDQPHVLAPVVFSFSGLRFSPSLSTRYRFASRFDSGRPRIKI